MRIEKRDRRPEVPRILDPGPAMHRRVIRTSRESFADLLGNEEHSNLQSMLEEVMRLGDLLLERRTLDDLEAYKNAVRQFVRYSVDRSLRLKKGRRMSGSVSLLVETVDAHWPTSPNSCSRERHRGSKPGQARDDKGPAHRLLSVTGFDDEHRWQASKDAHERSQRSTAT